MKCLSDSLSFTLAITFVLFSATALAEEEFPNRIQGDVGGAIYASNNPIRGDGSTLIAVPYGYFDYGRFFARFDTFGIKTLPLGYGYVEVVGRINLDGFQTNNSILRGIRLSARILFRLVSGLFRRLQLAGFF